MPGSIRIDMNRAGIIEALTSPGVEAELMARANRVAATAEGIHKGHYKVTAHMGRTRVRVSVITADGDAMRGESVDRALTRALDAARRG